ncbi:CLCA_X family protein [Mangrovitalea sediminis]|uniref:CLCA_X family protein n=1 Tax=Mangrovitalea sediminis TaxID=1982043 RepID=UPI000BE4FECC|nr:CLCA_X family protein [Mangrovitalea sediminis]
MTIGEDRQLKGSGGTLLAREFYRRGPALRDGSVVSFLDIRRRFDFRSIEIGRWVTEPEKQRAAGLFHDALCDLMQILQGPESLISLRGTLGLQYGIGGRPGVAAHYVPASRTFALAKNAGPGSIAHEWFHAFDHYICGKAFQSVRPGLFASRAWLDEMPPVAHPLNTRLQACFKAVLLDEAGQAPSVLFRQSVKQDELLGRCYYSQPEEMCARAFEAFVQDASIKNAFLVKGTQASGDARLGLYPQGEQRAQINAAFAAYFFGLGRALLRSGEGATP